jgi:hypothetical protein
MENLFQRLAGWVGDHQPTGLSAIIGPHPHDNGRPSKVQADWGSAIYDAYGFYTSVNGALAAWGY